MMIHVLEGHYLNLPVLDNGIVTGMVDVLKLTYVTLEQVTLVYSIIIVKAC